MKYLLIAIFLAVLVGIEFFHEHSVHEAPGSQMCTADGSKQSVSDFLHLHLHSHR